MVNTDYGGTQREKLTCIIYHQCITQNIQILIFAKEYKFISNLIFLNCFQVISIELIDKRGYLTISLSLAKEGKILLRRPEGIKEWFQALKVNNDQALSRVRLFHSKNCATITIFSLKMAAWPKGQKKNCIQLHSNQKAAER